MLLPAATGSGASVLEMLSTGAEVTVVVSAAPFTGAASFDVSVYDALVITVPFASGRLTLTTSCTDPEVPALSAPMFQVTTPPASVPPPVAETNVVFAGMVSAITTPVALAFPVFEYEIVYVMLLPAATGSGASVFDRLSTGAEVTVVVSSAPPTGPTWVEVMP